MTQRYNLKCSTTEIRLHPLTEDKASLLGQKVVLKAKLLTLFLIVDCTLKTACTASTALNLNIP